MGYYWLGIGLGTCGSVVAAGGLALQKLAHNEETDQAEEEKIYFFLRYKWWLGFLMLAIIPGFLEGWALMLAPLSVIAPLSGNTVIFNTVFAVLLLKEKTNRNQLICLGLIIAGIGLCSAFGAKQQKDYTSSELIVLFEAPLVHAYIVIIICDLAASAFVIFKMRDLEMARAFAFANFAGCAGGTQNMFLKCSMELLDTSINGNNQFDKALTWLVWVAVIGLAVVQIASLNMGMAAYQAISYIPMYQAAISIYGAIAGGVYFQEFYTFTALAATMFTIGVMLIGAGIYGMGLSTPAKVESEESIGKSESEKPSCEPGVVPAVSEVTEVESFKEMEEVDDSVGIVAVEIPEDPCPDYVSDIDCDVAAAQDVHEVHEDRPDKTDDPQHDLTIITDLCVDESATTTT